VPHYAVKRLDEVPRVAEDGPEWFPLSHHFGLTGFGANVFRADAPDVELVEQHDETASGQEELFLLIAGDAVFELDGEPFELTAPAVVAVPDPHVRRAARSRSAGATLLALGARGGSHASTWDASHFEQVPRA
jgi:uncharacterized cupin superfamily protein